MGRAKDRAVNRDRQVPLARTEGDVTHKLFLGAEEDLIRNVHGIAKTAGLDGDELGYILAAIAKIKRVA